MSSISTEARQKLADAFTEKNQPWFAIEILKGQSKQFDTSLEVITAALQEAQDIYDRYS